MFSSLETLTIVFISLVSRNTKSEVRKDVFCLSKARNQRKNVKHRSARGPVLDCTISKPLNKPARNRKRGRGYINGI